MKSIFVSLYVMAAVSITMIAGRSLWISHDYLSWGVRIALVSPQPHKSTIALAKRFDVPFDFLTDEGNKVAK